MSDSGDWHDARCHCGTVRFRVQLDGGLASARRCTCSLCRMRGAVTLSAALDGIEIVDGAGMLTEYRFNTGTARHFFCSRCGIYTHHNRRSNPNQFGVNAACLEGISPFDFACVPVNDGIDHPADGPANRGVVGYLRFESVPKDDETPGC